MPARGCTDVQLFGLPHLCVLLSLLAAASAEVIAAGSAEQVGAVVSAVELAVASGADIADIPHENLSATPAQAHAATEILADNHSVSADDIPHAVPRSRSRERPESFLPPAGSPELERCNSNAGIIECASSGCFGDCTYQVLVCFALLSAICMGADTFGRLLSSIGFPAITTFILFGMLCGPFFLELMLPAEAERLEWINDVALGFIGLTAGGKLHVSDLKLNLGAMLWVLFGMVSATYVICLVSIMLLGDYFIAFMGQLDVNSKLAVSLLFSCLAVARSPSSAIAIIEELHAKGPFTTTVLTVTIFVDVAVVLLWALTQLLVSALNPGEDSESSPPWLILLQFLGQTIISVIVGSALGKLFSFVMYLFNVCTPSKREGPSSSCLNLIVAAFAMTVRVIISLVERSLFLVVGYAFMLEEDADVEAGRWQWQSPMIVCMVCGFVIVNYTHAGEGFAAAMHDISNPLYLIFFTYTGLTMDLLSLMRNWLACVLLFSARTVGVILGSRWGGRIGKQPEEFCKMYWLAMITQAGVSLGLALSVPDTYVWKPDFVATSVALIVCNQVVGPPLFKWALKQVKEDNHGYHPKEINRHGTVAQLATLGTTTARRLPQPRGGLIIGAERDDVCSNLVTHLRQLNWEVVCADANLCVHPEGDARRDTRAAEGRAVFNLSGLSSGLREKVKVYRGGKSLSNTYHSVPVMMKSHRNRLPSSLENLNKSLNRTDSFHQNQIREKEKLQRSGRHRDSGLEHGFRRLDSLRKLTEGLAPLGEFVSTPELPDLPKKVNDAKEDNPDFYSRSMRLLWLIASMRNIDVIVVLLPTDKECIEVCELVSEMLPLVKAVRHLSREEEMPQVVVTLQDPYLINEVDLEPPPLVISQNTVLQSLISEILHPTAHWTGSLPTFTSQHGFSGLQVSCGSNSADFDVRGSASGRRTITSPGSTLRTSKGRIDGMTRTRANSGARLTNLYDGSVRMTLEESPMSSRASKAATASSEGQREML